MAYALISWDPPAANEAAADQAMEDALTLNNGASVPVRLTRRLMVYPSPPAGISFSTVRGRVKDVVEAHPGMAAVIVMPDAGDTVAGWFTGDVTRLDPVREILNKGGSDIYPRIL